MTTLEAIVPVADTVPVLTGFEGGETTVFDNGKPLFKYDGPARSRQEWAAIHALARAVRTAASSPSFNAPANTCAVRCVFAVRVSFDNSATSCSEADQMRQACTAEPLTGPQFDSRRSTACMV